MSEIEWDVPGTRMVRISEEILDLIIATPPDGKSLAVGVVAFNVLPVPTDLGKPVYELVASSVEPRSFVFGYDRETGALVAPDAPKPPAKPKPKPKKR